jgi:hypothetical protein
MYVDNYLMSKGYKMTFEKYHKWRKKGFQSILSKPKMKKQWTEGEKRDHLEMFENFLKKNHKYETVIRMAKDEWILSTDGLVCGLRYKGLEKRFVAQVKYTKEKKLTTIEMFVTDDWVIDTYGKDLANKLIDREKHCEYIQPLREDGTFAKVKVDDRTIMRVKYYPPKYKHKTDKDGSNERVTDEIYAEGVWKARLEDGTVTSISEAFVMEEFGKKFVKECKTLGNRKFVSIPVGSCRSSAMSIFPGLRHEKAPPVHFMQGDIDRCVFSSLASAFNHTGIPDLVRVATILQEKSNQLCGGAKCLKDTKQIVAENVKWLQPKRMPKKFEWQNDINSESMFFVGVMKDSSGSCQHAVTIFRKWIYDSNEPFALPLSKESLDLCTWSINDGMVEDTSMFVCFVDGWIFQEIDSKKKKKLDVCAYNR